MPVTSELPWHLTAYPTSLLANYLGFPIPVIKPALVIGYFVVRHKKKHQSLPSIIVPTSASQTPSPSKAPKAAKLGFWYRLGHGISDVGRDITHFWKLVWGNKKEGVEWIRDMQYPRPGNVMFYPLRPDLDPYLNPDDAAQPVISEEQKEVFAGLAKQMYTADGKGKVPKSERIEYDSYKRKDRCSGRNLIWNYLHTGDGSVPDGLDTCPGYVRLLMDHHCGITPKGTSCLGFHPTEDVNLNRYAYPNNTWNGLGDPLRNRIQYPTAPKDNSTDRDATDMYLIDIGNGTLINLGIHRSVAGDELNLTALAEGTLPNGVELYGPGWKSEYDVDDENEYEARKPTRKRAQLPNLAPPSPRRYGAVDLSRHVLYPRPDDSIADKYTPIAIPQGRQAPIQVLGPSESNSAIKLTPAQATGFSISAGLTVFLIAFFVMLFCRRMRQSRRTRCVATGGVSLPLYDGDAAGVDMQTFGLRSGLMIDGGVEVYKDVVEDEEV